MRSRSRSTSSALPSRTVSSSATASTTPDSIESCRGSTRSASGSRRPAHLAGPETRGAGARLVVQPDDVLLERVPPRVAGRVAENFRGLHPLVADAGAGQLLHPLQPHTFHRQDLALCLGPASTV